jgi:hypothetical protein
VERARGGCRDLCRQREEEERTARAAFLLAQQNRAASVKRAPISKDDIIKDKDKEIEFIKRKGGANIDPQDNPRDVVGLLHRSFRDQKLVKNWEMLGELIEKEKVLTSEQIKASKEETRTRVRNATI